MPPNSLNSYLQRLAGVYRDPQRVLRDAETLLSSPLGSHLTPTTEPLMLNDGSSTPPVLLLRGTLPMTYRGVTYNLPIDMYLPPPYPLRPPTVFIRPVVSMAIKENHRHVGLDGRVYLPYLHEWRPGTHDLRELAVWMSSLFGSEPPCYARAAGAPSTSSSSVSNGNGTNNNGHHHPNPPPPPYTAYKPATTVLPPSTTTNNNNNRNAAEEADRRKKLERDISEANRIAEIARQADAEDARLEAEQKREEAEKKRQQKEHQEHLNSMRAMATSKVQYAMQNKFQGTKVELRVELMDQKKLEFGKERIDKLMLEGEERKGELERGNEELDEAVAGLQSWLEAAREQQQSASSSDNNQGETSQCKADLMALPADTHSAQMLALSAENAAIDDCIYFLDKALVRGSISLEVFLKEVRRLSKRQFMAKAHLIKIAQTRAAGHC